MRAGLRWLHRCLAPAPKRAHRPVRGLSALCLAATLAGCAVDLSLAAGVSAPARRAEASRASWGGDVRATLMPGAATELGSWFVDHVLVGAELGGRALSGRGAHLSAGAALGLGAANERRTCYGQLEAGAPFGFSTRLHGFYAGFSAGYLFTLGPRSAIESANGSFRGADFRMQLGPSLRYRTWVLDLLGDGQPRALRHDVSLGLSLRVQLVSDFL